MSISRNIFISREKRKAIQLFPTDHSELLAIPNQNARQSKAFTISKYLGSVPFLFLFNQLITYPQLRATPSLTVSSTASHYRIRSENARDASGISNDNRHINGVNIQGAVSSGQTAGFAANLDANNAAAEVTLDAEM